MMQTRVQRGPVVCVCMGKQFGTRNSLDMDIEPDFCTSSCCNTTPTRAGKIVVVDERASEPRRNFFLFNTFKSNIRRRA